MPAHVHPHPVDVLVGNGAVGPREIDVLKDAKGAPLLFRESLNAFEPAFVDDHDFAGLDIADEFGVNQVERTGFAGENPGIADFADAERTKTVGITDTNELLLGHDHERIGAFDSMHRLDQVVLVAVEGRLGHQM